MPLYTVRLSRRVTETYTADVEAPSDEEAVDLVLERSRLDGDGWVADDYHETNVGNVEEVK